MSGSRLELANPDAYGSPREYIERHLAPAVAELHRVTNELLTPGSTSAEDAAVDMVSEAGGIHWQQLDKRLQDTAKHVVFDGSTYFTLPKDLLKSKQVKVQLIATVYAHSVNKPGTVQFRLVRGDNGEVINGSFFETSSVAPVTVSRDLPFNEADHCIQPHRCTYFIVGRADKPGVFPVCRRFSLSFVYI